ncbi:signaling mucin MSB2 [Echria macrotheca]|uniref:Signaling mucin MSB2 n=1 Tax=Echria macrotheca TaxID=438768 RepID=A0AAJ0BJF5_9PEZI|nr:signaling mucin MSB2 [Echria macrotheca]
MRTTSVLVAALVAASSVAAQQETRRFYYPRHIKRQFTNVTITSGSPSPSSADGSTTTLSTKRDDVLGNLPINLDPPTDTDVKVTTVVVQSTVYVAPTPNPFANGTIPDTTKDEPITPTAPVEPSSSPADQTNSVGLPLIGGTTSPTELANRPTGVPTEPTASKPEPTLQEPGKANSNSTISATFDSIVSVAPTTTWSSSSSTPIVIAPTGVVSESTSHHPEPTTPPSATEKNPLEPISSVASQIVSVVTSLLPPLQNATESKAPETTPSPLVTIPDITPSGTGPISTPPPHTSEPLPTETVTSPPVSPTVVVPPPVTNSTEPPPPVSSTSMTVPPPPPSTTTTSSHSVTEPPPPPPSSTFTPNVTISANTTTPPVQTQTDGNVDVTSIPHLGPTTISQSWLPTTILVDPTSTTVAGGLAPTTATGIPTGYPRAITPETGQGPIPQDTVIIQIGLLEGYNYPFVVKNEMAAAQIFDLLKKALNDYGGFSGDLVQVRKLVPLDTSTSLGYITTLVYTTYPKSQVGALQMDIKIPASSLYNNPDVLTYNFTKQINPSIEILIGSYPDDASGTDGSGAAASGTNTPNNGSPFSNDDPNGKSSGQQGTTAGIVTGAVAVAAAYGAAMFIIARRYKRKRQSHRRASSISNPSEMQQTPRSSPALMGGALLSRDFTSYGGVLGGRDSHGTHGTGSGRGGRDSHGSGRSGMGNSARTQYISAPVAAENSLGWN